MTPREPDRYEAKAWGIAARYADVLASETRDLSRAIAAALRAEAVNALDAVEAEFRGWSETTYDQRDVFDVLNDVRAALASPAAAPATETDIRWEGRLTVPSETIQALRYAQPAPPSEPAAPAPECTCPPSDRELRARGLLLRHVKACPLRSVLNAPVPAPAQGAEARDAEWSKALGLSESCRPACVREGTVCPSGQRFLAARAAPHAKGEGR